MIALELAVLGIAGVIMLAVLKKSCSVYATLAQIAMIAIILLSVLPQAKELLSVLDTFSSFGGVSNDSLKIMIKIFGILTVGSVTADICRDNGENAVANTVELAVKILAVSCALPVFTAVISVASSFFNR